MASDCPQESELLAWLRDACDSEMSLRVAQHVEACPFCQAALEKLSEGDGSSASDDLLRDLRRVPPTEELEAEPECERASTFPQRTIDAPMFSVIASSVPETLTHLGRHEILGLLGQGGMGIVYKARNRKLDRLMAIKVLPSRKLKDTAAVARFAREIKTIAHLAHPNIVAAYDADEADGKHFLVMEYVDGVDLASLVKTEGPMPASQAVDCIVQAARGLHYAHQRGIVHRDVKPANLMLDRGGTIKVLDLGLALFASASEAQGGLTDSGVVIGTVDYLAPEQAENTSLIDRRADIYSLGCTLFFLLTGKPLHAGATVVQKIMAHRDKPMPSLREVLPPDMAALEPVFAKMVAVRAEDRYQTLAEVIADLEAISAPPLEGSSASTVSVGISRQGVPTRKRRRWAWGLAAAALSAAIAGFVFPRMDFGGSPDVKDPVGEKGDKIPSPFALKRGNRAGQAWSGSESGMKFRWCPPGRFAMGSPDEEAERAPFESPQVPVTFSRGFWLGECEVSQKEWESVVGTRPSRFQGPENLPVENVSWQEAARFCELLTERDRAGGVLSLEWEYRLPTEAQWEYACRAGSATAFYFGDRPEPLGDYAWFGTNSAIRSHEIGQKKPNAWGFHDMHGNLWEWCRDWFKNVLPGGADPETVEPGKARVIRGGGWNATSGLCRSGFRSGQLPEEGGHLLGFRVAAVQVPDPPARKID